MRSVVIYYSQSRGNTARIAEMIRERFDADIFRIETKKEYKGTDEEIVNQGKSEVYSGYVPEIKKLDVQLYDYDMIFLGTPTWWYTMAPAMTAFLQKKDWKNRRIVLFATCGGWTGRTLENMKKMCAGAELIAKKSVQFDPSGGNQMLTEQDSIEEWMDAIPLEEDLKLIM